MESYHHPDAPELTFLQTVAKEGGVLPSFGELLKQFASIAGVFDSNFQIGKKSAEKKSLRTEFDRLRNPKPGKVNLDNYRDTLWKVIEHYDSLTDTHESHWLSGALVYHYFQAYQNLVKFLPVFMWSQPQIDSLVSISFIIWTTTLHLRVQTQRGEKLSEAWWVENPDPYFGFDCIMQKLKQYVGQPEISDFALIRYLNPDIKMDRDTNTDIWKEIEKWRSGKQKPYFSTLEYYFIKPLENINPDLKGDLYSDILTWYWISHWISYGSLSKGELKQIVSDIYQNLLSYPADREALIPSSGMMKESDIISDFQNAKDYLKPFLFQDDVEFAKTIVVHHTLSEMTDLLSNVSTNDLISMMTISEYRYGLFFENISQELLERGISDPYPEFETVFKLAYYHNIIPSGFSESKDWRRYRNIHPFMLQRKTLEALHKSRDLDDWLKSWDKKSINDFYAIGGFSRTRLMIAAFSGNKSLVSKLIQSGAEQCKISKETPEMFGDNSSALLLALLGHESPMTPAQKDNCKDIILMLLKDLRTKPVKKIAKLLSEKHSITQRNVLTVSLEMGMNVLSSHFIDLGVDVNAKIGGDDFLPMYEAVAAYSRYKRIRTVEDFYRMQADTSFNQMRMELDQTAMNTIIREAGIETWNLLLGQSIETININKPKQSVPYISQIKALAKAGADPNRCNTNGRYPLDLAYEVARAIGNNEIVKTLKDIGAYKRAIY